jgi:hypothetical protein
MGVNKDDSPTFTGNMTILGTLNSGALTVPSIAATSITVGTETVTGNSHIQGSLTVDGAILGPNSGGAWTIYTPIITAGSGTFTTVSASGKWQSIGKTVFLQIEIIITTNGSASGAVIATLPINSDGSVYIISGRENSLSGKILQGICGVSSMTILNYDNTYPGGSGATIIMTGIYQSA